MSKGMDAEGFGSKGMSSKSAGNDLYAPDFRTPLSKVRGLGSAREGTGHFIQQRVSAISNLVLVTLFLGVVIALMGASWLEVRAAFQNPIVALIVLAAMLSVTYHMRIGLQVVIEDYVHGMTGKALLILNTFVAAAVALTCAFAVLKMAFQPPIIQPTAVVPAIVAPAT